MKLRRFAGVAAVLAAVAALVSFPAWAPRAFYMPHVEAKHFEVAKASAFVKVELAQGHGSATHIGSGYYLSAGHVVDGVGKVTLRNDHDVTVEAEVLWTNTAYDIALMRTVAPDWVEAVPLACVVPDVGSPIVAHGNPGMFEFITAQGYVGGKAGEYQGWRKAFLVDMSVLGGMSGGAVMDRGGRLVGVTVAVLSAGWGGVTGFGLVVPGIVACELLGRDE